MLDTKIQDNFVVDSEIQFDSTPAHKGNYIDLDIPMPFETKDLFTDIDYEFAEEYGEQIKFKESFQSKNIQWLIHYNKERPAGSLGYITSKEHQYALRDYFNDNFQIDIMKDMLVNGPGKIMLPVTLIKFQHTSHWNREGYAEWMVGDSRMEKAFAPHRSQFAINFKLYGEETGTATEFGEPSEFITNTEKRLAEQLVQRFEAGASYQDKTLNEHSIKVNDGPTRELIQDENGNDVFGVWPGRDGFTGTGDDLENKEITTTCRREGYSSPYIINLQKMHRVITTGTPRISMRFMCGTKRSFSEVEALHEKGLLLK